MQRHVREGNSKVNESEDGVWRLGHSFEGHAEYSACGAQQRIEDVVAEGAGETVQDLEQVVDDEEFEVVLAFDEVVSGQDVTIVQCGRERVRTPCPGQTV